MFDLGQFVKKGFLDAVGRRPNYWVILNSAGWMEKGVLSADDLTEISDAIDRKESENSVKPVEDSADSVEGVEGVEGVENGNGESNT